MGQSSRVTGRGDTQRDSWPDIAGSWIAARVIVLLALGLARFLRHMEAVRHHPPTPGDNLLGWDAVWYAHIAAHGYAGTPAQGLRFFPLYPLLSRGLSVLLLGSIAAALLVLANGAALGYLVLVHRLALLEGLGADAARRAVWVASLAPGAFVLVMGYAESLYGCLLVGCLLAVRTGRWGWAAALGALAGATRPTGVVLAVFVLVEACRGLRETPRRQLMARAMAVAAPVVGLATYLLFVGVRFGDPLLPFTTQTAAGLRGGVLVNPLSEVLRTARGMTSGHAAGALVHTPWVVLALALLVLTARRLAAGYTALAACWVFLAMTARGFSSFERYASACVPLLLAACSVRLPRPLASGVLAAAGAALFGYSLLAFLHLYVP